MKRHTPLAIGIVIALLTAGVFVAGCSRASSSSSPDANTVTASGSGTVHAAPDQADMSFGVTKSHSNAKAALESASKAIEEISAALEKAGVAKEDIQTQNVNVNPDYDYKTRKPTITGYSASITVRATVRDIGTLGDVITAGNNAGANSVYGPSFTLSDDSELRGAAIEKAVADAHRRAEAMAKATGKTVGAVVSISESVSPVSGVRLDAGWAYGTAKAEVAISPGQLDLTADVTVVYELR